MKLLIVIVQDRDVSLLMEELVENEFSVTKLATTGGFLKEGNSTLLLGVNKGEVEKCLSIIDENCKKRATTTTIINSNDQGPLFQSFPLDITVGGATIFILDVEQFIKY